MLDEGPLSSVDVLLILSEHPFFGQLPAEHVVELAEATSLRRLATGERLFREGELGREVYYVHQGRLDLRRGEGRARHLIGEVGRGELLGELAILDDEPRSAEAIAAEPTTLLCFDGAQAREIIRRRADPGTQAILHMSVGLANRLRRANDRVVAALERELEELRARTDLARLLTLVLGLMVIYAFALKAIWTLVPAGTDSTWISSPLVAALTVGVGALARKSGRGWAFYGATLEGWPRVLGQATLWTLPFLALLVGFKLALTRWMPDLSGPDLFIRPERIDGQMFLLLLVYVALVPLQEFIIRGVLQGSLRQFLVGPRAGLWAVLLSNGVFGFCHLHISAGFGLVAAVPGLYWGWMYDRQRSLLGASLSHALVGAWALFALDLGPALERLA